MGKRQLFDRSMEELREVFVTARFAQDDVFGRADIEAWLAAQRTSRVPDHNTWQGLIERDRLWSPLLDSNRLHEFAMRSPPDEFRRRARKMGTVDFDVCGALLAGLDQRAAVYQNSPGHSVVVTKHIGQHGPVHAITVTSTRGETGGDAARHCHIRPATETDLLLSVLNCGWTDVAPETIWTRARQLLCDALEHGISNARFTATAAFESAVAVSADGTKVVHANWVVVSALRGMMVFPAKAFFGEKMLRPANDQFGRIATERLPGGHKAGYWMTPEGVAQIAKHEWSRHRQSMPNADASATLIDLTVGRAKTRIYVTSEALCPEALPDGGFALEAL